jgi:hypothetical protein
VAAFDLGAGELVWEHGLEDVGLNAVFSVHRIQT